jgi:hypothetical protein
MKSGLAVAVMTASLVFATSVRAAQEENAPEKGAITLNDAEKKGDAPRKIRGKELRKNIQEGLESLNGGELGDRPPPPRGGEPQFPPNFDFMRHAVELNLSDDERAKLKKLAFEKPEEFRSEVGKLFKSLHQKRLDEQRKTLELRSYRDAKTQEQKDKALVELKKNVEEQFDKKMEFNRLRLEETERNLQDAQTRLAEFRKKYEERKAKAREIVDERVKELVKDPSLEW